MIIKLILLSMLNIKSMKIEEFFVKFTAISPNNAEQNLQNMMELNKESAELTYTSNEVEIKMQYNDLLLSSQQLISVNLVIEFNNKQPLIFMFQTKIVNNSKTVFDENYLFLYAKALSAVTMYADIIFECTYDRFKEFGVNTKYNAQAISDYFTTKHRYKHKAVENVDGTTEQDTRVVFDDKVEELDIRKMQFNPSIDLYNTCLVPFNGSEFDMNKMISTEEHEKMTKNSYLNVSSK